jgi:hypothetical protein
MESMPDVLPRFPRASEMPFASFNGKYAGQSCYVVGRGPTDFDYAALGDFAEPIFFINDAVCMEKHAQSETFFFAHDAQMLGWLNGRIKSTAVLPIDGKVFRQTPGVTLNHAGKIVFYHWREENRHELLGMTRQQIAKIKQLYTHTGTIHSVLHFIWYCGFARMNLIGCDCGKGYDLRLENLSHSVSCIDYSHIGKAQQLLTMLFGLEAVYMNPERKRTR